MGRIHTARDERLGRDVAVKRFAYAGPEEMAMRTRFLEEARIVAQLQHPGIIPIYELTADASGTPCFSMPRINGHTLAALLRESPLGASGLHERLRILRQVVATVDYAHSRGVVHCDLKPENIMVGEFGEVYVLDWGLARCRGGIERPKRGEVLVAGTPAYMAPELASGECTGAAPRLDVFSIGAILCEILTGKPPFSAGTTREAQLSARMGWIEDATRRLEACPQPAALVSLALACLEVTAAQRIASLGEVAKALDVWTNGLEAELRAAEHRSVVNAAHASAQRRLWRRTTFAAALVIALLVAGWVWRQQVLEERAEVHERMSGLAAAALHDARAGMTAAHSAGAAFLPVLRKARSEYAAIVQQIVLADLHSEISADVKSMEEQLAAAELAGSRDDALLRSAAATKEAVLGLADQNGRWQRLADAFAAWGWKPQGPHGALTDRVKSSCHPEGLCDAIDLFMLLSCGRVGESRPAALAGFANSCDADVLRSRIRSALVANDATALKALAVDPDSVAADPRTQVLLGESLKAVACAGEAREFYRSVVTRNPGNTEVVLLLGEALVQREPPEAVRLLWMVLSVHPRSVRAWALLTMAHCGARNVPVAREALGRLRELAPESVHADLLEARILLLEGKREAALLKYESVIVRDPRSSSAHMRRGMLLTEFGRKGEALAAHEEAARLDPGSPVCQLMAACLNQELSLHEAALQHLEAPVVRELPDPAARFRLGVALQMVGRFEDAARSYEEARQLKPDDAEATCNLGLVLMALGKHEEGLALLRTGHARGTASSSKWAWDSAQWLRDGEQAAALASRLAAGKSEAASPEEALALGRVAATGQDQALALKLLLQARTVWDTARRENLMSDRFLAARAAAAVAACGEAASTAEGLALELASACLAEFKDQRLPTDARRLAEWLQELLRWEHDPLLKSWNEGGSAIAASGRKDDWEKFWALRGHVLHQLRNAQQTRR